MLSKTTIERVLNEALEGGDFAEVFCERSQQTSIESAADRLEGCSLGEECGVGIRIFRGLSQIYAYTNTMDEAALLRLARQAAKSIQSDPHAPASLPQATQYAGKSTIARTPTGVAYREKMDVLRRALNAGKGYSPEIAQVQTKYLDMVQQVQIANTDNVFAEDTRTKTRLMIVAYAQGDGELQSGYVGPGAMGGFEFYDGLDIEGLAREAARVAVTMLHAEKCTGGRMPVVVENGFGGLLFHEACGHSLEASSVALGLSEFSGRLGQQIASPVVTLIDDGTLPGEWGSLHVDDEGTPTQRNVLIQSGILRGYMIDRMGARRMQAALTGSARRQSYRFAPTSRMTNTFIQAGESRREDLIAQTERGLYVRYINGGSVNPATGDFNFAASESYWIENGKITRPVNGATLIGNGGQILRQVDMVADNPKIRQGYCYAGSGALFIGAGQPTVRVADMTVGGVQ